MTLFSADPVVIFVNCMFVLIGLSALMVSLFERRKPVWQAFARAVMFGAVMLISLLEYAYTTKIWSIAVVLFGALMFYWMWRSAKLWHKRWGRA